MIRDVSDVGHFGTRELEVSVKSAHELETATPLIRQSYEQVGG